MIREPAEKRVTAFFDGQNLFHAVGRAFGYRFLECDPQKLAEHVCGTRNAWKLIQTRFYTGVPSPQYDPALRAFWNAKLTHMGRQQDVIPYSRELKYSDIELTDGSGKKAIYNVPREKGVDLRLGIEAVSLAYQNHYDIALIFSQDQDFTEVVREVRSIAALKGRWIKVACAYLPDGHDPIHGAEPILVDRAAYDACRDPRDYRQTMAKAEKAAISAGTFKPGRSPFNPPRFSN